MRKVLAERQDIQLRPEGREEGEGTSKYKGSEAGHGGWTYGRNTSTMARAE